MSLLSLMVPQMAQKRRLLLLFSPPPTPTYAEEARMQTVDEDMKVETEVMSHHVLRLLLLKETPRGSCWNTV